MVRIHENTMHRHVQQIASRGQLEKATPEAAPFLIVGNDVGAADSRVLAIQMRPVMQDIPVQLFPRQR